MLGCARICRPETMLLYEVSPAGPDGSALSTPTALVCGGEAQDGD